MPPQPKIVAVLLEEHDALQAHRAGLDHHADDREHERQLVGDELRGGAQRAEQRVLVGARPAGHQHADDRQARHRERVEDADVEVVDHRRAGPAGITTNTRNVDSTTTRAPARTRAGRPRPA